MNIRSRFRGSAAYREKREQIFANTRDKVHVKTSDGKKKPLANGIQGHLIKMCVVADSVKISNRYYAYRRKDATITETLPIGDPNENVFDIRVGDYLFTMDGMIDDIGFHEMNIAFSALNGMRIGDCQSSWEVDRKLKFLGCASETGIEGDLARSKMPMTVEVTSARSVVNTGPKDLQTGDLWGLFCPYFFRGYDMYTDDEERAIEGEMQTRYPVFPVVKADHQWLRDVIGIDETTRLIPHTLKIDEQLITNWNQRIYYNLISHVKQPNSPFNNIESTLPCYFPTANMVTPSQIGNYDYCINNLIPDDAMAVQYHNHSCLKALTAIVELLKLGILRPGHGVNTATKEQFRDTIEKIAGVMGFYESRNFQENFNDIKREHQSKFLKEWLFRIFNAYLPSDLQRRKRLLLTSLAKDLGSTDLGFEEEFLDILLRTAMIGEDARNRIMLDVMEYKKGRVIKGGKSGQKMVVDYRAGY